MQRWQSQTYQAINLTKAGSSHFGAQSEIRIWINVVVLLLLVA